MKKTIGILTIALLASIGTAFASVDKAINVSAAVLSASSYDVKLFKSTSSTTYDWNTNLFPAMNFGTLKNAVDGDPTSALTAANGYVALVSVVNNSGATYRVQFTGAPLLHTDGTTRLSNDAFTVAGGVQYDSNGAVTTAYSSGVDTTKRSAGSTTPYNVYNSNSSGVSDSFRVYFGLTGDPTQAVGAKALIPPGQKAGNYSATLHLTLYP